MIVPDTNVPSADAIQVPSHTTARSARVLTERLELRGPNERDRTRFVELYGDLDFMAFSAGPKSPARASELFDQMLADAEVIPFSKRPVVLRASGAILGYCGVAPIHYAGEERLEFGYRLAPEARGRGIGLEAGAAMLELAGQHFTGELLAIIDPDNEPSQRLATRLGFTFWKTDDVNGFHDQLWTLRLPRTRPTSSSPGVR